MDQSVTKKEESPDVDRKTERLHTICAFIKINDVQKSVNGMNDLLNVEMVDDNLKTYYEAWCNIQVALEKGPEGDLLDGPVPSWRSGLPHRMPWRCIIPIRLTAKRRRATCN